MWPLSVYRLSREVCWSNDVEQRDELDALKRTFRFSLPASDLRTLFLYMHSERYSIKQSQKQRPLFFPFPCYFRPYRLLSFPKLMMNGVWTWPRPFEMSTVFAFA